MIDTKVNFGKSIEEATKRLTRIEKKQIPFATSLAINSLLGSLSSGTGGLPKRGVLQKQKTAMRKQLHKPLPYTVNAFFVRSSRKDKTPVEGFIGFREFSGKGTPAHKYLTPNIQGGKRRQKRHEVRLKQIGVLGSNQGTAPGRDAQVNARGNLSGAFYTRTLAAVGALGGDSSTARSRKRNRSVRGHYIAYKGGRAVGIRRRANGQARSLQLLNFINLPTYRAIYDYEGVARDFVRRSGSSRFVKALKFALRTAK